MSKKFWPKTSTMSNHISKTHTRNKKLCPKVFSIVNLHNRNKKSHEFCRNVLNIQIHYRVSNLIFGVIFIWPIFIISRIKVIFVIFIFFNELIILMIFYTPRTCQIYHVWSWNWNICLTRLYNHILLVITGKFI